MIARVMLYPALGLAIAASVYALQLRAERADLRAEAARLTAALTTCTARAANIIEDKTSDAEIDRIPDGGLRRVPDRWLRQAP